MNKIEAIRINSNEYGKLTVYPDSKCSFGNMYFVTCTKYKKNLSGVISADGEEIIPMQEMELQELINTPTNSDFCLGFKCNGTDLLQYYHIKKNDKNGYRLVTKTSVDDEVPLQVRQVPNCDNYWIFEAHKKDKSIEYSVYSIDKAKIITNFFDKILILEPNESEAHRIYFLKNITVTLPDSLVSSTSTVCGFLDENGLFSSKVLATDIGENGLGVIYDSRQFGIDTLSSTYEQGLENVYDALLKRLKCKNEIENDIIKGFFNSPNIYNNDHVEKTKIIDFKPRKNV